MTRNQLYKLIEVGTKVKIIDGKNIGDSCVIISKSKLNNNCYPKWKRPYCYHNFFSIMVDNGNKIYRTSCDNIKIIDNKGDE